jgi:hypothetical protein
MNVGVAILALIFALDFAALWLRPSLAWPLLIIAVAIAVWRLVYLLNKYDFPWPWRRP